MKTVSLIALGFALALGGVTAPALAAKKEDPAKAKGAKLTPAVQTNLFAAQKALEGGDAAGAAAKYNEAKAAIATDDDRYTAGTIAYKISQANKDQALASEAVDMMVAGGKAAPELQRQLLGIQAQNAYQAKDYRKAQTAGEAAIAAGSTEDGLMPLIVSAMELNGQPVPAVTTLNDAIAKRKAAGQPVPQEWYQRGISIAYGTRGANVGNAAMHAPTMQLLQSWVSDYPTKSNWHDAITIYSQQAKVSGDLQTDVYRLSRATGSLTGQGEYLDYVNNVYLRYPQEALTVMNEGTSKGVLPATNKDVTDITNLVKPKIAADKASLVASDKSARAAANGRGALNTADAYVSYGQYAQAVDLYKVAIQKGGVDLPTAQLRLGVAQALANDAAGAKTSFAAVTGSRKPIADFWTAHLDHPTAG